MSAPYRFDRYRNGRLMAEGIKVNKENCLEDAIKVAARLADHGDVLVYDVAIAAALAKMGAVQVKPLVWTAKGYAQTPFGKYLVVREDWSGQEDFWFVCFAGKPYGKCGEHSSEEAAKAAAQADYEARILAAIEPAPQEPEKYTIGDLTMDRVFKAAGLTNVSDMQAVFDQVEVALRHAIQPAPVSVREAARVLLDECKDGEVWPMYVNAMMPVLNAELSADSWNTVDEIRAAFAAALRAIAEGEA